MKRALALIVAAMLLALLLPLSTVSAHGPNDPGGGHGDKIVVCHNAGHHPVTITISKRAWPAHKRHGDTLGACAPGPVKPPKPSAPTVCTFDATTSSYYNGANNTTGLYATGPIHFSWTVGTGAVAKTGGTWNEKAPPPPDASSVTYFNKVAGGNVSAGGSVTLSFTRTIPDKNAFGFTGALTVNNTILSGLMAGTFYSATGTTTCSAKGDGHGGDNGHGSDQGQNEHDD